MNDSSLILHHLAERSIAAIGAGRVSNEEPLSVRLIQDILTRRDQVIGKVLDSICGRNNLEDGKAGQNRILP